MVRRGVTDCLRCRGRVQAQASYCPRCGLPTRGLRRLLGALPVVLAGASVAAFGGLLQGAVGPWLDGIVASGAPGVGLLAGPPAEVLGVSDVLFAFFGAGLASLALGRPGLLGRLLVGGIVAVLAGVGLLAAHGGSVEPARALLVCGAALGGALCGAGVIAWSAERAPFVWLARPLAPLPWPVRYLAMTPAVALCAVAAPWLVLGIYVLSVARWQRGVTLRARPVVVEAGEEAPS